MCAANACLLLAGFAQQKEPGRSLDYPAATVREEQNILVDGAIETWRLQWAAAPKPYCQPSEDSLTCPCMGFAYGEAGDLFLTRLRRGRGLERLHLTPFFTEGSGKAIVQRWPADYDRDFKDSERPDFSILVGKRAIVEVMHFADFDHDGRNTEFYLQTESVPCGTSVGIVIGTSSSNPRLHVFGRASNPGAPLYLNKRAWEAVRDASGPVEVPDWACDDHGAETETRLQLQWSPKGIEGVRMEYSCPPEPRRLLRKAPL